MVIIISEWKLRVAPRPDPKAQMNVWEPSGWMFSFICVQIITKQEFGGVSNQTEMPPLPQACRGPRQRSPPDPAANRLRGTWLLINPSRWMQGSWDSPCRGRRSVGGGASVSVVFSVGGSQPALRRRWVLEQHFPRRTSCHHRLTAASKGGGRDERIQPSDWLSLTLSHFYPFAFSWFEFDGRKSRFLPPSPLGSCLFLSSLPAFDNNWRENAGCVSSPVATSCYSDGPELIGRWELWWRHGETYGGMLKSWKCLLGSWLNDVTSQRRT